MGSGGTKETSLREVAAQAVELARRSGASEAAAVATRSRDVEVSWRDGKVENVSEATERNLSIDVYVEGRYSSVATSDLRPEALADFVQNAIAMTRTLQADKDRRLPEPELYQGQASVDLQTEDASQAQVTPDDRRRFAAAAEEAARAVPGAQALLSVTTSASDGWLQSELVTSNGFAGSRRTTYFTGGASVTAKDSDGRRPEDGAYAFARHRADMPDAGKLGKLGTERALARLGSVKGKSGVLPAVVENRTSRRLLGILAGPLAGSALQQKRSFFEGMKGKTIGSKLLTITDDPFIPRSPGSRLYDGEGLALRKRPIFEEGVLRDYYIDTYYARKLGVAPTSGMMTNAVWKLGDKDLAALCADVGEGILISSFLGGNSNGATGDFSLGVRGTRIRGGKPAEPIGEMNISGNQLDVWKRLVAVGNDPYPWDGGRSPSLVFDKLQFAGV